MYVMHNSVCSSVDKIMLTDGNIKKKKHYFEIHILEYSIVGGCMFQCRHNCKYSEILLATESPNPSPK